MKVKIIFTVLIIISIFSCRNNNSNSLFESFPTFYCDMEKISDDSKKFIDSKHSDIVYNNANLVSSEKSFSGKNSIKLNKENQFGLSTKIKKIKAGDFYNISVWRFSENENKSGHLVISIGNKELYIQQKEIIKKDSSGWEQIGINFRIPPFIKTDNLKIYVWQAGEGDIFFDDLKIEKIKEKHNSVLDSSSIKLFIEDREYNKIIEKRNEAMKLGVLETQDDSWINAILFDKNDMFDIKMRLKGDWTDHIEGAKWSFRIKMKKDGSWKGMREFSIQDPKTRFFQYEWLGHKIMEKEDVLSPRYGFIPVYINNTYIGIYAYEEHFVKQMLESKKRREGPILKMSETGFWLANKLYKSENKWFNLPVFESSSLIPYKQSKIFADINLKSQFIIAQNLLEQHKNCKTEVSYLFDIEKAAKYFALIDLTKMYHGMRWHNQRFYYNTVTSKLELIAYDGYTEKGVFQIVNRSIIGNINKGNFAKLKPESRINYAFFSDSAFIEKYVSNLKKFSDSIYINGIFNEFKDEINLFYTPLTNEYPTYKFDKKFYLDNAQAIQKDLPAYIEKIKSGEYRNVSFKNSKKLEYNTPFNNSLPEEFVKVYSEAKQNGLFVLKVINYLPFDIEVTKINNEENNIFSSNKLTNTAVGKFNSENNEHTINTEYYGNKIIIKVNGFEQEFSVPVNSWQSPKHDSPRQELINKSRFPINEYYVVNKNTITFKTGKITVTENIIIPPNYKVVINSGTELDFINNSLFLSYSAISIFGKESNKVMIHSSDNTAKGFTVIEAKQSSDIQHVIFSGFNTLNYKGWTLTGAVNFYESDVSIAETTFQNNFCEDALNIIRSNFTVQNCSFENIFSDAFDSDFCTGKVSKTNFNKIGNDAIDFSGSYVEITDCNISNAGDKGISGGENSTLTINNCFVSDSKIGMASKDKSTLNLNSCKVQNCYYGLVAFQKKPEYGPAIIKSTNLDYSNIINLHLIEKKSFLQLNKNRIIGYDKNTAKRFY